MRLLVFASLILTFGAVSAEPMLGKVVGVTERNSLWFEDHKGTRHQLVLAFLSIPAGDQPYADRAGNILRAQLLNHQVSVRPVGSQTADYVNGLVYVGTHNFNLEFLSRGHAWVDYQQPSQGAWLRAQLAAQAAGKGLFANPEAIHPIAWATDKPNAEHVAGLLTDVGGFISENDVMANIYVGHRGNKIYVDATCLEVWGRWSAAHSVPLFTKAGAHDSGFVYQSCSKTP